MKPFNLERALAGDKVVTRAGKEVTELHYFNTVNTEYMVYAVIDGATYVYNKDGKRPARNAMQDLLMSPKIVTKYVNIYTKDFEYDATECIIHPTAEHAKHAASYDQVKYRAVAVPVEFEEV